MDKKNDLHSFPKKDAEKNHADATNQDFEYLSTSRIDIIQSTIVTIWGPQTF